MDKGGKFLGIWILWVLLGGFLMGCSTFTVPGKGDKVYVITQRAVFYEAQLAYPLPKVYDACLKGLRSLKIPYGDAQQDQLSALIQTNFADGVSLEIRLKYLQDQLTSFQLSIGEIQNRERATMILKHIFVHLD